MIISQKNIFIVCCSNMIHKSIFVYTIFIFFIVCVKNIRDIFILDFGEYEYECLYVDHEDENNTSLIKVFNTQKALIKEKYGECHIKTSLRDNLINE
jgi:hypothetical protein